MSLKNAFLAALIIWVGLQNSGCGKGTNIPDVSGVEVDVPLRRFDRDLFALDTNHIAEGLQALRARYPEFAPLFFGEILGADDPRIAPQGPEAYIRGFITHPPLRRLYDTCQIVFSDMEDIHREFEQAFRFFKYYFPDQPVGDVTTFLSEYTLMSFVYGDNRLAVGLDFFLGEDYPYAAYNPGNPNFSSYLTRTFNKDHLVLKAFIPLVQDLLGPTPGQRLLDHMIHKGKELYILDRLLPYAPDTVIMEYSREQWDWVQANELDIWAYLLSEDLLYSVKWNEFRKLVEYSPHSPGMPPEAPGRTAAFIGWRIVDSYMQRHPQTTLPELIALRDAQSLLDQARYKPRRR